MYAVLGKRGDEMIFVRSLPVFIALVGCTQAVPAPTPKSASPSFAVKDLVQPKTDAEKLVRKTIIDDILRQEGVLDIVAGSNHSWRCKGVIFDGYGPNASFANFFALTDAAKVPRKNVDDYKYEPKSKGKMQYVRVQYRVDEGGIEPRPVDVVIEILEGQRPTPISINGNDWLDKFFERQRLMYPTKQIGDD